MVGLLYLRRWWLVRFAHPFLRSKTGRGSVGVAKVGKTTRGSGERAISDDREPLLPPVAKVAKNVSIAALWPLIVLIHAGGSKHVF